MQIEYASQFLLTKWVSNDSEENKYLKYLKKWEIPTKTMQDLRLTLIHVVENELKRKKQ